MARKFYTLAQTIDLIAFGDASEGASGRWATRESSRTRKPERVAEFIAFQLQNRAFRALCAVVRDHEALATGIDSDDGRRKDIPSSDFQDRGIDQLYDDGHGAVWPAGLAHGPRWKRPLFDAVAIVPLIPPPRDYITLPEAFDTLGRLKFGDAWIGERIVTHQIDLDAAKALGVEPVIYDWPMHCEAKAKPPSDDSSEEEKCEARAACERKDKAIARLRDVMGSGVPAWVVDPEAGSRETIDYTAWHPRNRMFWFNVESGLAGYKDNQGNTYRDFAEVHIDRPAFEYAAGLSSSLPVAGNAARPNLYPSPGFATAAETQQAFDNLHREELSKRGQPLTQEESWETCRDQLGLKRERWRKLRDKLPDKLKGRRGVKALK